MENGRPSTSAPNNIINLDSGSSSPPSSPPQSPSISERDCSPAGAILDANRPQTNNGATGNHSTLVSNGTPGSAHAKPRAKPKVAPDGTTVVKKPRKQKEPSATDPNAPKKEPKKRAPRDPNAPPAAKRRKKDTGDVATLKVGQLSLTSASHAPPSTSFNSHDPMAPPPPPTFSQVGKYEPKQENNQPIYGALQQQQQPARPQSSGQRYDPIRSASAENAMLRNVASPIRLSSAVAPSARASPSIASLIDPPNASYSAPRHHMPASHLSHTTTTDDHATTTSSSSRTSLLPAPAREANQGYIEFKSPAPETPGQSMPIGPSKPASSTKPVKAETPANASSSKQAARKDGAAAAPLGSGLLSGSGFGTKSDPVKKVYEEVPNQCIVIEVPMNQEAGNYVNFIREVENKYGFDVAHPRQAEHRRRMAQMAAAGAALEPGLGDDDDMQVDTDDSNVEGGGAEDESNVEGAKKKLTKKTRNTEYDKTDDFIDDTEQMWEEQAMATNNGYFVWSGPLVQEPVRAADEKPDGTVSKRGRGRGRGGTTRGETSTRARARGGRTRGDGTTRKPRITKADRAKMEIEQRERENYAAAAQKSAMQAGVEE